MPQATPEALLFFFRRQLRERNQDFSRNENPFVSYRLIPAVASEKRIQALDPEDTTLSAPTADYEFHPITELTDQECKKGQLTQ